MTLAPPRSRRFGARHAIARDNGRRQPREQKRLVADGGGGMHGGIDTNRPGQAPAIAAAQEEQALVRGEKNVPHRERGRRLARAADGRIADADDRHSDAAPLRAHAQRRHRPVDAAERAEQAALTGLPPESRLAHQAMIPNEADRNSEWIMPVL